MRLMLKNFSGFYWSGGPGFVLYWKLNNKDVKRIRIHLKFYSSFDTFKYNPLSSSARIFGIDEI